MTLPRRAWSRITMLLVVVAWTLIAANVAQSTPPRYYSAVLSPGTLPAGNSSWVDATLTNFASDKLGSANLRAPSNLDLTGSATVVHGSGKATVHGDTVKLRDLSLSKGKSVKIRIGVTAACTAGAGTWDVAAKKSRDFSGSASHGFTLAEGSVLTTEVSGDCALSLRFLNHPADAEKNAVISSVPVDPDGEPIRVEIVDATGARATTATSTVTIAIGEDPNPAPGGTLSGQLSRAAVAGVATFDDLAIDLHGTDYTLVASSAGMDDVTSNPFTIWDIVVRCEGGASCAAALSAEDRSMDASISTRSSTAGSLMMSLGADTLDCGDTASHAPQVVRVDSIDLQGTKTVTMVVSKEVDQQQPNNGVAHYQVCFSGEEPFVDRDGTVVPAGGQGLLPDCRGKDPSPPCVASKKKIQGGRPSITVTLPPGDPMMR